MASGNTGAVHAPDDHLSPPAHQRVEPSGRDAAHQRWGAVLVTAAWAWVVLPRLVQSLTGVKGATNVGLEPNPATAAASATLLALTALLIVVCSMAIADTLADPHPGRVAALLLMLAPWMYLVVRDLYTGQTPTRAALMYPLVVTALWMVRPRLEVLRVLGLLVGLSALISIALGVLAPGAGLFHAASGELAVEEKAILPSGILVGFLSQGNNLGQALALGLPFVFLLRSPAVRWFFVAVCGIALVWTASRSSLATVGLEALALVLLKAVQPASRRWLAPLVVAAPVLAVCALPLVTRDPTAFTNRGRIWDYSLQWWETSPVFGLGSGWYQRVGETTDRLAGSVFHGHNQLVQLLATGGAILTILVFLQLLAVVVRASSLAASGAVVGTIYLVGLAGTCVLEKSIVIVDNTNMFAVVAVPLALLLCGDRGVEHQPSAAQRTEPAVASGS